MQVAETEGDAKEATSEVKVDPESTYSAELDQ
jgi:hypothetical protein